MLSSSDTYLGVPIDAAATLDELLAYHDQSFIVCAYKTLLGREPDREGLGYYLGRFRTGIPKIQLLAQLRLSKEGSAYAVVLPGLEEAIKRQLRGQYPLIGWLFRLFDGTEGNYPTERKLRGIENQLFLLSNESNRRIDHLEAAIVGIKQLIVHQTQSIASSLGDAPLVKNAIPSEQLEPIENLQLSSRAKSIYHRLKLATPENYWEGKKCV